jgi:hypothetical protein
LFLLLYLDCITNQEYSICISPPPAGWGLSGSFSMLSKVCIADKIVGVGDGVRRCHNSWCTHCLGGLLDHVPDIFLFHLWSFFLVKGKPSSLGAVICWVKGILLRYQNFVAWWMLCMPTFLLCSCCCVLLI